MPAKPKKAPVANGKRSTATVTSAPLVANSALTEANVTPIDYEQIRQRAYQLYEQRGRNDGFAEQDWLQAEAELMSRSA